MIKAITFDLWNTIFEDKSYSKYRFDFFIRFLEKRKVNYKIERVKHIYEEYFTNLDYNPGNLDFHHISIEERLSNLFNALKIRFSDSDRSLIKLEMEKEILKDPPLLKKGVETTLEELSPNYKIGLISNTGITPGSVIIEVFKSYKILDYFQVVIFSDEIGVYKPNPLLFKIALNKLKCKPKNAMHIGDQLHTDIEGAKALGMLTIWLNDVNRPKSLNIQPDYEINQINEVVHIIKNLI